MALLEHFWARRRLGDSAFERLTGKEVDAFVVLEKVLTEELMNVRKSQRSAARQLR